MSILSWVPIQFSVDIWSVKAGPSSSRNLHIIFNPGLQPPMLNCNILRRTDGNIILIWIICSIFSFAES